MANDGINWGSVVLGALGITAAALVAPSVLGGISETIAANASAGSPLASVGTFAGNTATSLSSTYAGVANSLGIAGANFSSLNGVYDALSDAGSKAISWVGDNPQTAAIAIGGGVVGGAVLGQMANKGASAGRAPGGMSYTQYVEARRRMAAMSPQARTT